MPGKLICYILAIVIFLVMAIIAIAGGGWDTPTHLTALLGLGLAFFTLGHIVPPTT